MDISSDIRDFSVYYFAQHHNLKSKVPKSKLVDKTTERNFQATVNYMGNPRLLKTPMLLLLPNIRDISGPLSCIQEIYVVNMRRKIGKGKVEIFWLRFGLMFFDFFQQWIFTAK